MELTNINAQLKTNQYLQETVAQVEKDILQMEEDGKRSIFAPGFYTMISKELKEKVKTMTKKEKY